MSAVVLNEVRKGFYLDSVALMRISRSIAALPGVIEAALMMGTPANRQILADAGLLAEDGARAQGNDLVVGIRAEREDAAQAALAAARARLEKPRAAQGEAAAWKPRTLRGALKQLPTANLALISVPGDFAAAEARKALRRGLHVMIFSDNVPVRQERELKEEARALRRLVMGPDCGTAILNGVPLAFANRVPRGDIGVIGASGTGIQEVTSLVAQGGKGISHAIGTGGRDLSGEVGGLTTLMAIDALDADPATRRIVLISKPPHPSVARTVLERVARSPKPFTICFLGADGTELPGNARFAPTLTAAAADALGRPASEGSAAIPAGLVRRAGPILGLYAGGTLCAEAQLVLKRRGRRTASNAPVPGSIPLAKADAGCDRLVDLGADEYTRGRPHPMIDPGIRDDLLLKALADARVGAVLIDLVIGFGAHTDPAAHFVSVVAQAAADRPPIAASVTGTDQDPQSRARQVMTLERAGILVAPSNAQAAELAAALAQG
jgi:FdrA protein